MGASDSGLELYQQLIMSFVLTACVCMGMTNVRVWYVLHNMRAIVELF
jgi:hypothetical protein